MSIEALNDFFKSMDTNDQLSKDFDGLDFSSNVNQKVVDLAQRYGYEFTLDELHSVIEVAKHLRDEQLDKQ